MNQEKWTELSKTDVAVGEVLLNYSPFCATPATNFTIFAK